MQKFIETGDSKFIHQNEIDKGCFQHDMAYGGFKNLPRRTIADKNYVIKHLVAQKVQNMVDINAGLLQWFIDFLIKILLRLEINLLRMERLKLHQTKNKLKNYTNQLLETS